MRELREEQRRMKSDVRDLGFAGLKACGGLRDQVCIHQADRGASEILVWRQRARPQHKRKKKLCQESRKNHDPACTSVLRSASASCDQPTEERKRAGLHAANRKNQTQMQAAQQRDRYGNHKA